MISAFWLPWIQLRWIRFALIWFMPQIEKKVQPCVNASNPEMELTLSIMLQVLALVTRIMYWKVLMILAYIRH